METARGRRKSHQRTGARGSETRYNLVKTPNYATCLHKPSRGGEVGWEMSTRQVFERQLNQDKWWVRRQLIGKNKIGEKRGPINPRPKLPVKGSRGSQRSEGHTQKSPLGKKRGASPYTHVGNRSKKKQKLALQGKGRRTSS